MRNKKIGTWIARLLITMLTFMGLGQTMVHAVDGNGTTDGPLTDVIITKVVTKDDAKDMTIEQLRDGVDVATYFTDGKVLPGVSFTWYSVTAAQLATMEANPLAYDTVAEVDAVPGVGSGTATAATDVNGQVTISNLPEGNYWVVENAKDFVQSAKAVPFGLVLPFTNAEGKGYLRTIKIYPKNTVIDDQPEIEKKVDKSNVAIGDLNTWTVSLDIPVGIEYYDKFSFYDDIDSRLTFEGVSSVEVDADGISFIAADYDVTHVGARLEVVFTEAGRIKLKGADPKKVHISFGTRVNDTAIMGQEIPNSATLQFDNGYGTTGDKTPEVTPEVHTGGKAFVKMDGSSEAVLENAEFKIKNIDSQFVKVGANGVITFGAEGDATIFISDANGKFEVKGLPYGDYMLVETKAPQGYALPTNPNTEFTVNATSYYSDPTVIEVGTAESTNVMTVNNRALVIPQTGGIGTALFTVIGAVMMLFSAFFYKKTKEA